MIRTFVSAALAAAATLAAPGAARAGYVLDSFGAPTSPADYFVTKLDANPFVRTDKAISPGVDRTITVTVNAPPLNTTSASGVIGGGVFESNSDNSSKVTSKIEYALTGSAADLSKATGLALDFLTLDAGTAADASGITIDVVTKTGTLSFGEMIPEKGTPFTRSYDFASFTGTGDLGAVDTIRITVNGGASPQTAIDFALDAVKVKVVPAPPAVLLAGVGLLGLIGRSRFRRATA